MSTKCQKKLVKKKKFALPLQQQHHVVERHLEHFSVDVDIKLRKPITPALEALRDEIGTENVQCCFVPPHFKTAGDYHDSSLIKITADFRRGYSTGRTKLGPALNNFCIRLNPLLFYITYESKCQVLDYQGSWNRQ